MVLKEKIAGTNAVALVIREKNIAFVKKEEHYIDALKKLNCIAGPIFSKKMDLIMIIDISSEEKINDDFAAIIFLLSRYIERNYSLFEAERVRKKFDGIDIKILKLTA